MIGLLRHYFFTIAFLCILLALVFFSTGGEDDIRQLSGYTMGTTFQLQIVGMPEDRQPDAIVQEVTDLLAELDTGIFSTYAADSELSRLNRHEVNVPFIASRHLIHVLEQAQSVAMLTDGAFDVTVGPLVNLWGFGPIISVKDAVPAQEKIAVALENVGYEYLQIDPDSSEVRKTRDIYVDLSGIAKGYAVDQVAAYFDAMGVNDYFLEIGGELKIKGRKTGGVDWVPAIEAPIDGESKIYEVFTNLGDAIGVAGSGDYRNYFEENGVRYSHEIDPGTGRPISHNLAAVYVIEQETAIADALATAFMVMGVDAGRELAERENMAVYFIYKTPDGGFAEVITDDFARYLRH